MTSDVSRAIAAYEHSSKLAAETANKIALATGDESPAANLAWQHKSRLDDCAAALKRANAVHLALVGADHD